MSKTPHIPKERPLTEEEKRDWVGCSAHAFQELPMGDPSQTPLELLTRVQSCVDEWQAGRRPDPEKSSLIDTALSLGAVWGDQIAKEFGWEWTVVLDGKRELYAVATKDRALVIYPSYFIKACLEDEQADCTVLLSFNMLREGKITGAPAASYTEVMPNIARIVPTGLWHSVPLIGPMVEAPPAELPLWDKKRFGAPSEERILAEFDSRDDTSPDEFTFECVRLRGLKEMRVHVRVERSGPREREISLFPRRGEALAAGAKIFVHIIDANGRPRLHYYPKGNFLLPGRRKLDATVLALQNVPVGYDHEVYPSRDQAARGIVHIYKGDRGTVVIVYSLCGNGFENCSFFVQFARQTAIV